MRTDNFRAFARKLSFLPIELDIFDIRQHDCTHSIYLQTSDLLSLFMCNTVKHDFSSRSIWKWIKCCNDAMNNDVMNTVDCLIKRDVYPQKNAFMI